MPTSLRIPAWAGLLLLIAAVVTVAWPAVPRATFVPDDYRYLAQLRDIDAGVPGAVARSTIVENRWDDNWWIEDGTYVRFFRPLVILSYALDRALCGESEAGFIIGNIVLHLLVSLLVWGCLRALLRADGPALLGAVAFATHSSRAEQLSYVAGRTDTLAALFFFAGLWSFLRGRGRGGGGWLAGTATLYLLAMLSKEYAVLLPAFFLLADRWAADGEARPWLASLRQRRGLYVACAGAAAVFFVVRWWALGEAGSGVRPFPYFHLPDRAGFAGHAIATSLQYAVSLVSGLPCATFLTTTSQLASNLETLFERAPAVGFLQGTAWLWIVGCPLLALVLLAFGLRSARGRFFVVFFLVTLVPMLPLYSTSRYLYLPGLGWCGLVALAAGTLWRAQRRALAVACAVLLVVPQAAQCRWILTFPALRSLGESDADSTVRLLQESRLQLSATTPVYLVDLPRRWLVIQFLQAIVDVRLPDPPRVRVLCKAPYDARTGVAEVERIDDHTIELTRPNGALEQTDPGSDFDQRRVRVGERIREADYEVTVLAVAGDHAQSVRIRFDRPLAELAIGKCLRQESGWRIVPVR